MGLNKKKYFVSPDTFLFLLYSTIDIFFYKLRWGHGQLCPIPGSAHDSSTFISTVSDGG
jgi:hypothetical protein